MHSRESGIGEGVMPRRSNSGHHMHIVPQHYQHRGHCAICYRERPLYRSVEGEYLCYNCLNGHKVKPAQPPQSVGEYDYGAAGRRGARIEMGAGDFRVNQIRKRKEEEKASHILPPSQREKKVEEKSTQSLPLPEEWERLPSREIQEKAYRLWEQQKKSE